MPLSTQTLAQLQALWATQYTSVAALPANTDPGSALGAIANADSLLALQIQNEIIYADQISRLATSVGVDIDSFVNPFGIYRIGAEAAEGTVTFSTPSPVGTQTVVPVGAIVTTQGGLQFAVIADPSQPTYSATLNGYVIAVGSSSTNATVQCTTAGTIGNVLAGQITVIFGSPSAPFPAGVTSVTNAAAFTNGVDQESDAALAARFTLTVSSGRVATANAITAAVLAIQAGLIVSFGDMVNADLSAHSAFFTLVVNEANTGTGASSSLLTAATSAINATRSAGISFACIGPTLVPVNAVATIAVAAGFLSASVIAAVQAAYTAFVNGIGLDGGTGSTSCSLAKVYAAILLVPGVADVTGLTLNGGTADIVAPFANQLVAGTGTFTPA